jgi:hypothetical protein
MGTLNQFIQAHVKFFWKPNRNIAGGMLKVKELKKISIYEVN